MAQIYAQSSSGLKPVSCDNDGKLNVNTDQAVGSLYVSAARERTANLTAKAVNKVLRSFFVNLKTAAATQYIQLHNAATGTVVATGTLVISLGAIVAGDVKSFDAIELDATVFTAGVKLALSSTEDTYTDPTTDDGWWSARVE